MGQTPAIEAKLLELATALEAHLVLWSSTGPETVFDKQLKPNKRFLVTKEARDGAIRLIEYLQSPPAT